SLTLANITAAQTGSYYLVVTTAAGSTQSASAFVGIVTPYTFTVQPIAQSAATGSTVVLSAVATGFPAPSSYQWYKNNVAVSGATSNTLTLVNVQPSDAGNYTVNVIGTAGVAASNSALLTVTAAVLAAPSFTQQPASVWVAPGSNPTFTAAVSGTPAPTLQWCKNGVPIPGATNVTLSLSNVQSADAGAYTVVATSSAGTVTSAAATLTVSTSTNAPVFSLDLISPTVAAGGTVTFTVAVVGTPTPTLQWFKNGVAIVGATNSTLKLSNLQSADAGVYTVVATNLAGTITSGPGTLTVWVPTNSPIFSLNPDSQTVTAGSTVTFTVAVSGTPSPTLQWYKNGVAITGATGATLTLSNVQPADAATYTVVATNSLGTATSGSATLVLGTATGPVVMAQPASHMMAVGSTVILSVDASGTVTPGSLLRGHGIKPAAISDDPLTYQWKKNGAAIAGATSSQLRLTNLQAYDAGGYRVTISNAAGSVTSNPATLDVVATGTPGRIINLSVRTVSGPGEDTLIMGFVVGGANTAGTKQLLIRGIGPTLANFGVPSAMVDSQLEVLAQGQAIPLASNDNWAGDSVVTTLASATGAFMLPDPASKDAALTTSLARGIYSAKVGGVQQTTGTVLAEIYDGAPANFAASSPRLINVSARARMANDNPLIAGFVIGGSTAKTVMIRAVGPFLSSFFGSAAMSDPKLELYVRELGADRLVVTNDNWGGASLTTAVGNSVGAFTLPEAASKDAVLLLTLEPGIYSAKVTGVAGASGIVLIEVYELP
ncbi:MAG: hypothetical protein JWM32_190, partial [Verrucomicrobia bacterium]|nr:hypothetical protein [Verrucomicrobiota bacterium]